MKIVGAHFLVPIMFSLLVLDGKGRNNDRMQKRRRWAILSEGIISISQSIYIFLSYILAQRFSFLLTCSSRKSDYFIYKLSISPFFFFFQFTRISETIPFRVVEDIFLTVTDQDQLPGIQYCHTRRILVFCCGPTWLLP